MSLTMEPTMAHAELPMQGETVRVREEPAIHVPLTLEVVLYVALIALAAGLRLVNLGAVPLNDFEAHDALAALRAVDVNAPGDTLIAHSPITQTLDVLGFSLLVPGDATARLPGALAGMLLALAPVLWRRYLNPLPPLIISLLLTLSPTVLLASRTADPAVFTMLLAVIAPYLVLRYVEMRRAGYALGATTALAAMIFLTEGAGFVGVVALALGVVFALLTDDDTGDESEAQMWPAIRQLGRDWPWVNGLIAAGVTVVVIATLFMLLPEGLSAVGQVVVDGVRGFYERPAENPVAFPLWVALRYEFGIVLFGLMATIHAIRYGGFFERTLAGWLLAGLVFAVGYSGAGAGHALWLTVPGAALVGLMMVRWLVERPSVVWKVPAWGVPVHALITLALWLAVGMSVVLFGKLLLVDLPDGVTELGTLAKSLTSNLYNRNTANPDVVTVGETPVFAYVLGFLQLRLLITVLVTMLVGVLFFLVGSLWGARAGWRGVALGTVSALVLLSLGMGGRAALQNATDAREFWFTRPVGSDVGELRDVLETMSLRDNGSLRQTTITAQTPDDGALAWALRDYPRTQFVTLLGPDVDDAIVLAPDADTRPDLGADYVGRTIVPGSRWDTSLLSWRDVVMWTYRSASEIAPVPEPAYRLWVRKDIYGVDTVPEE